MTRRKKLGFYDLLNRVEKNRISRFSISSVLWVESGDDFIIKFFALLLWIWSTGIDIQNIGFAVILKCQVRSYSMFPIQAAQFLFDYRFQG